MANVPNTLSLLRRSILSAAILISASLPHGAAAQTADEFANNTSAANNVLVTGTASARKNCGKLRRALTNANASASNPVLIGAGGGKYNCGTSSLELKPFVTIEGAGRNATFIFGDVNGDDQAVVQVVKNSHVGHLTIRHRGNQSGTANVVRVTGIRATMSDVAVEIDSDNPNSAFGIRVAGGSLALSNVSVRTKAANGQSQGIRGEFGSHLEMMNTWVQNESGAFGNPAALELRDTSTATGFGIVFSSNFFGILGRGASAFSLFDGTIIGGRGTADSPSFSCIGIADADFTARGADCS